MEQLAIHSECDVHPFDNAQHLPKVLVQVRWWDNYITHLILRGVRVNQDHLHAPDHEIVPIEVPAVALTSP